MQHEQAYSNNLKQVTGLVKTNYFRFLEPLHFKNRNGAAKQTSACAEALSFQVLRLFIICSSDHARIAQDLGPVQARIYNRSLVQASCLPQPKLWTETSELQRKIDNSSSLWFLFCMNLPLFQQQEKFKSMFMLLYFLLGWQYTLQRKLFTQIKLQNSIMNSFWCSKCR